MPLRSRISALLLTFLFVTLAEARVVSYAPYTDRIANATYHKRTTRHFALIESNNGQMPNLLLSPMPVQFSGQQLVLYDAVGSEEPRVIYPEDGSMVPIAWAALRENESGVASILAFTTGTEKANPGRKPMYVLSTDSGATWKKVAMPDNLYTASYLFYMDAGGPFTRGRNSTVRIGTAQFPFVVQTESNGGVFKIGADGSVTLLHPAKSGHQNTIIGSNAAGTEFIVRSAPGNAVAVTLDGAVRDLGAIDPQAWYEGWIASDGSVFLERSRSEGRYLYRYANATQQFIAGNPNVAPPDFGAPNMVQAQSVFFAVPTSDFNGAWMVQRGVGRPTALLRYTAAKGLETMWSIAAGPEIEALHTGASPDTLLIQVHRERAQPERLINDPALAVWHVGEPAPTSYDELFLSEGQTKGFVHLDVDRVALGDPFVFDSGQMPVSPSLIISPSPAGGGSDVVQEWGVVRASLKQQLVLPGIGRTHGAYGSNWSSDVIFYNPENAPQKVVLDFSPNGAARQPQLSAFPLINHTAITLGPREIRLVPDALKALFDLENGTGALFITPDIGINATSRTYTRGDKGTYGFGMNAIDLFATSSPRFPVSFAGAFPGKDFRTNLILTDASRRGSTSTLAAAGTSGAMGFSNVTYTAPADGQLQINDIGSSLGLLPSDNGGLVVTPRNGWVVASVFAVDNRTNDPTYFPPDLPSSVARTIAVMGHVDGANDSKFRTDLYLFNPSSETRFVSLTALPWNTSEPQTTVPMTLLPNEARVIRDAYFTLFGRTGVAKLRYQSSNNGGVRVTARTYSIDENGGTYGFLTAPMNGFQAAASGESLEILGVTGGKDYRTNLGLLELNPWTNGTVQPGSARIEIIDEKGLTIDSFVATVPVAGGIQINDLFRGRNLGDGPPAALIRISPTRGQIAAYATVTDNGTNDSIYLAPNLAASRE